MTEIEKRDMIEKLAIKLHKYFSEDAEWIWESIDSPNFVESNGLKSKMREARSKFEELDEDTKFLYFQRAQELFDIAFMEVNK